MQDDRQRLRAAISLLYAHPDASEMLIDNALPFNLSPRNLLYSTALTGQSDTISPLTTTFPEIKKYFSKLFHWATRCGLLPVMDQLMALAPDEIRDTIDYNTFLNAALTGQRPVLARLMLMLQALGASVPAMINVNEHAVFINVAFGGHLAVMELLMECADDVPEMIKAQNYSAFRSAAEKNHAHITNRLLLFPTMLAYAEQHEREYGEKYTHPFITQQLSLLRTQQTTLETEQTQAVFNIDEDNAQLCFYMLRNLIRRNDAGVLDDIRFLLNIPAVKALVHTAVSPNQPNELIRLALTTGNQNAASLLFTIPAVRALAAENNFYQNEVQGGFDLRAVARDNESSMRALSTGEQHRLSSATARYEHVMKTQGVELLFQDLCEQLKARYTAHPARIQTGDGRSIVLPLHKGTSPVVIQG